MRLSPQTWQPPETRAFLVRYLLGALATLGLEEQLMLDRVAPCTPVQVVLCTPGRVAHYMLAQVAHEIQGLAAPVTLVRAGHVLPRLK